MYKLKKHKAIIMLLALMLAVGVTVPSTLAYLQAETETVKNTFVPVQSVTHDLDISVTGEKILEGRDWQENDSFLFNLEIWDAESESWKAAGTEYVVYGDNSFDLSDLVQNQLAEPGVYTFRVTEGKGSLEYMTYDDKVCKFQVQVTADEAGAMSIATVTDKENTVVTQDSEGGDFTVAMQFKNTYVKPPVPPEKPDPEEVKFDFSIEKTVKNIGDEEIGPGGFDFQLEKDSTGEEWTKTTNDDGKAVFHMSYDKEDIGKVYIYELTEIKGDKAGVTYDSREYEIKVGIELDEEANELIPTILLDGKEVSKVEAEFENIYEAPEEPSQPTEPDKPTDPSGPSDEPTDSDDGAAKPTDGKDAPGKDKGTQTGDDSSMFLYVALLLTSAVIMVLLFVERRRRTTVK